MKLNLIIGKKRMDDVDLDDAARLAMLILRCSVDGNHSIGENHVSIQNSAMENLLRAKSAVKHG